MRKFRSRLHGSVLQAFSNIFEKYWHSLYALHCKNSIVFLAVQKFYIIFRKCEASNHVFTSKFHVISTICMCFTLALMTLLLLFSKPKGTVEIQHYLEMPYGSSAQKSWLHQKIWRNSWKLFSIIDRAKWNRVSVTWHSKDVKN